MLLEKGVPMPVERTMIAPPRCRMGSITPEERAAVRARSPVGGRYDTPVNRESAHEILTRRAEEATAESAPSARKEPANDGGGVSDLLWGTGRRQGVVETMAKQVARTMGSQLGRQIMRGVLGGIFRGGKSRG